MSQSDVFHRVMSESIVENNPLDLDEVTGISVEYFALPKHKAKFACIYNKTPEEAWMHVAIGSMSLKTENISKCNSRLVDSELEAFEEQGLWEMESQWCQTPDYIDGDWYILDACDYRTNRRKKVCFLSPSLSDNPIYQRLGSLMDSFLARKTSIDIPGEGVVPGQ